MQACLQRIVLQNLLHSIWDAFQTIFECVFQSLFYKLLFTISKDFMFKPYFSFYASKAIRLNRVLLLKNLVLDSENMFDIGLKPFCGFYKIYEIGLA
jgi:hypothetical protein